MQGWGAKDCNHLKWLTKLRIVLGDYMTRMLIAGALALGLSFAAVAPTADAQAVPTVAKIAKPAEGTSVLIVLPTVSLGLLTASGSTDPKQEWSENAQKFLNTALVKSLEARKYKTTGVDVTTFEDPSALQLLKLNDAVTQSIGMNKFVKLPTKPTFDWTLGSGASKLIPATTDPAPPPAYALFLNASGNYQSGGRAALNVGMALLGGPIITGSQVMYGTLVDLKTGQVVWFEVMVVPSGTDIRTADGAYDAAIKLLQKLPL